MKTKYLKLTAILLFLAGSLYSCKEEPEVPEEYVEIDSNEFFYILFSASSIDVPEKELPEWLVAKIRELEATKLTFPLFNARIVRGEWRRQTVYFVYHSFLSNSELYNEFYNENGERLMRTGADDTELCHFRSTSKNWTLIWSIDYVEIDNNEFSRILFSAPPVDVPEEELPEWLVLKIRGIESIQMTFFNARIVRGEWRNRTVYFVYHTFQSSSEYYYEDGERIMWTGVHEPNSPFRNFISTSRNWVLIWRIEGGTY